jgi:hypothetical protein
MKIWKRLAPLSWRPYDDAVKFVHKLKLRSSKKWQAYCRGERKDLPAKPHDIPADPQQGGIYVEFYEKGGWGGWLGTGTVSTKLRSYRTYDEAVKFVHTLGLKDLKEWKAYSQGTLKRVLPPKPADIPSKPDHQYEEFYLRGGTGAWLGTGRRTVSMRSYEDAVRFVHALGLKSENEWRAYCRGERKDAAPAHSYKDFYQRGGMGAWLGTGIVAAKRRRFRPYDEAIKFVHSLGLKGENEWRDFCRGKRQDLTPRPNDIPTNPYNVYGEEFREGVV